MRGRLHFLELFGLQVIETQFKPVGVQNMSKQNMLHWRVDFTELKVLKKQLVQEAYSDPPLFP